MLNQRNTHSIESFTRLQGDETSMMAQDFLPFLRSAQPTSETAAKALKLVANWNGKMGRNMAAPLIFAAWYRELTRLVYADELGELFDDAWAMRPVFMYQVLSQNEQWCDDVTTASTESCAEQAAEALERAVDWLAGAYGTDAEKWRWGQAHFAHSRHQPFTRVPVLRWLFDITLPAGGGAFTVNRGMHRIADPKAPFASVHGPCLRCHSRPRGPRTAGCKGIGTASREYSLSSRYRNLARHWRDVEYIRKYDWPRRHGPRAQSARSGSTASGDVEAERRPMTVGVGALSVPPRKSSRARRWRTRLVAVWNALRAERGGDVDDRRFENLQYTACA